MAMILYWVNNSAKEAHTMIMTPLLLISRSNEALEYVRLTAKATSTEVKVFRGRYS